MTSRTTKQAARAYQKTHGVPYAEALRRVMQAEPDAPEQAVSIDPKGPLVQEVEGTRVSLNPGPGSAFDPLAFPDARSGQTLDEELVFDLGTGLLPDTGFFPTSVAARWVPGEAMREGRAATLGVYGQVGKGKTVYLMTLARDHLATVPTLVVSREPYPPLDGITSLDDPELVQEARLAEGSASQRAQETLAKFEQQLSEALAGGIRVVVYDDGPQEPLGNLLRTARSKGIVVLFTSHDVDRDRDGTWSPGRSLPEAAVTVLLDQRREPTAPTWVGVEQSWVRRSGHEPMTLIRPEDPYLPRPSRGA